MLWRRQSCVPGSAKVSLPVDAGREGRLQESFLGCRRHRMRGRQRCRNHSTEGRPSQGGVCKKHYADIVMLAGNCEVAYDHYRLLYKAEDNQQLRIVPKLTQAHIEPDCLRKMNVHLAEQLLSRGTAVGLEFYRNQKLPGLENSKGTAVFTKELNDLFDVFKAKLPKRESGLGHQNKRT
ncbi:hypothetical protein MTO96_018365 [Rhipicephalus appendiculatus]